MNTKNQEIEVQSSQSQLVFVVSCYQNIYGVYSKLEDAQQAQTTLTQKGRISSLSVMQLL